MYKISKFPNNIVSHYVFAVAKGGLKVTIMVIIDDILLVTKYLTCFLRSLSIQSYMVLTHV